MFSVTWLDSALDELADVWVQSDSATRAAVDQCVLALDRRLSRDPVNEGESRAHGFRITFESPTAVLFHIDTARRIVSVVHFWTF
jgi:hypothetical protein